MTIRSRPAAHRPSYEEAVRDFRWADSMRTLGWSPGADVSLGETLVDRHAASGRPAISWHGRDGSHRVYTFGELERAQQPVRESADDPRRRPGRPRRGLSAAGARDPRHDARRVEGGRDLRADLHGIRPRRDRVPPGAQRRQGAVYPLGTRGPRSAPAAGRRAPHYRDPARRERARRDELRAGHGRAARPVRARARAPRRPGGVPLHVRVDRPPEGRADRRQLPALHPSEHAVRRGSAGRRRLLAHRRSGLGVRDRAATCSPSPWA